MTANGEKSGTSEERLRHGRSLLDSGRPREALEWLQRAHAEDPCHAGLRSLYGLCLGLVERRYQQALELCASAAKQEFFNPEPYLNIARLHLAFGFKAEGLRYLRRGSMIDPGHAAIRATLRDLGRRTEPVLPFLPRRHLLNRWLGSARHRIGGVRGNEAAAV